MNPPNKPAPLTPKELDAALGALTLMVDDEARGTPRPRTLTATELWAILFDLKATRAMLAEATSHAQNCTDDLLKQESLSHYAIGKSYDLHRPLMEAALDVADGDMTIAELKEEVATWRASVQ